MSFGSGFGYTLDLGSLQVQYMGNFFFYCISLPVPRMLKNFIFVSTVYCKTYTACDYENCEEVVVAGELLS
jgi:hypothetical protein